MTRSILMAMVLVAGLAAWATAQDDGAMRQRRGRAIEGMIESSGPEALRVFAETHLAPAYRVGFAPGELMAHLARIREGAHGFGDVLVSPAENGGTRLTFISSSGETSLVFAIQPEAPHLIVALELEGTRKTSGVDDAPPTPGTRWRRALTRKPRWDSPARYS